MCLRLCQARNRQSHCTYFISAGQALGDEAAIGSPLRRREVGDGAPVKGDQNHVCPGGRVEVLPAEVVEDLDVKPGLEQQGGPALPGQAAEALGRPLLHEQIHMAGQIGACGELTDDGAGQGEGDVGKDFVGPFGQGGAEKIPSDKPHVAGQLPLQGPAEVGVDLIGEDPFTATGQGPGDVALPRTDLQHGVLWVQPGQGEAPLNRGAAGEKILGNGIVCPLRAVFGHKNTPLEPSTDAKKAQFPLKIWKLRFFTCESC